jgi:hypothetical protein
MDTTIDELRRQLASSWKRAASATRGGPEWDAAMAAIDDLEAQLRRFAGRRAGLAGPAARS